MPILVAVAVDDDRFSEHLIGLLRNEGYFVVEPEVAGYVVLQVGGGQPGIRITAMPRRGHNNNTGWSRFLPAPVPTRVVLAMLLRMAPPGRGTPLRGH